MESSSSELMCPVCVHSERSSRALEDALVRLLAVEFATPPDTYAEYSFLLYLRIVCSRVGAGTCCRASAKLRGDSRKIRTEHSRRREAAIMPRDLGPRRKYDRIPNSTTHRESSWSGAMPAKEGPRSGRGRPVQKRCSLDPRRDFG